MALTPAVTPAGLPSAADIDFLEDWREAGPGDVHS